MRRVFSVLVCCIPLAALAQDAHRVSFLEQEVRNLQRQVMTLSRRVDELTRPTRTNPTARVLEQGSAAPVSDAWVNAEKWRKLRTGMSELEVIESLGPPTSMREENGARVLLYAMEIGASGFLGGSVVLRDRAVVEVRKPELQ